MPDVELKWAHSQSYGYNYTYSEIIASLGQHVIIFAAQLTAHSALCLVPMDSKFSVESW